MGRWKKKLSHGFDVYNKRLIGGRFTYEKGLKKRPSRKKVTEKTEQRKYGADGDRKGIFSRLKRRTTRIRKERKRT